MTTWWRAVVHEKSRGGADYVEFDLGYYAGRRAAREAISLATAGRSGRVVTRGRCLTFVIGGRQSQAGKGVQK